VINSLATVTIRHLGVPQRREHEKWKMMTSFGQFLVPKTPVNKGNSSDFVLF